MSSKARRHLQALGMGTFGICLFCSSQGKHKSLDRDYNCYGIKEVYQDLIADCFDVQIHTSKCTSKLICLQCVERLREAVSFKQLVLKAVSKLQDPLSEQGDDKENGDITSDVEIKFETESLNASNTCDDIERESYTEEHHDYADMDLVKGELELLQRFNMAPAVLPTSVPDRFQMYLDALKNKIVTSKEVASLLKQSEDRSKQQFRQATSKRVVTEKGAHVSNLTNILMFSNATPFRGKASSGIICFYCGKPSPTIACIRDHIKEFHAKDTIIKVLWRFGTESIKMNVDVKDLKCTLCEVSISDLVQLKTHLEVVHKKIFYKQFSDRVVPFDMSPKSNYICLFCEADFVTFGSLERHMNNHFRNYICKKCGAGFVTKHRLKVHVNSVHVFGSFPCKYCKKSFPTQLKMRCHQRSHVTNKRFRCPHCNVRFTDYFLRSKHMTDKHGAKALSYDCKVCDKRFSRGSALTIHMKRAHLDNRDFHCDVCPYTCYSITELKQHSVKHTGERLHQCKVCSKSYARLKTLKEHMKIHNNEKRFVCAVCDQGFVQKCSLKGHIQSHHSDFPSEPHVILNEIS